MAKLLTHHDPYHIHATCGLLALLQYIYRLRLICLDAPNGGFGQNFGRDVVSMLIMAMPNITSYLFTIVNIKKGNDGFSIWKEYRGHAFVFAAKLWLFVALQVYALHFLEHGRLPYERYCRMAAEFGTMIGLQRVTDRYPKQVSTIRGMYHNPFSVFLAGFMQFLARAAMFYGTPDPRDAIPVCLLGLMVVQLNAFNMTLRKKRIIGPNTTQAFYTIMLGGGFYLIVARRLLRRPPTELLDPRFRFVLLALIAYGCRRHGQDRFSSWIVALAVMEAVNQQGLFGDTSELYQHS